MTKQKKRGIIRVQFKELTGANRNKEIWTIRKATKQCKGTDNQKHKRKQQRGGYFFRVFRTVC